MVTDFERVMMNRDGADADEAKRLRNEARAEINQIIEDGGSYDDVEEYLECEFGLEMDYIFDLM